MRRDSFPVLCYVFPLTGGNAGRERPPCGPRRGRRRTRNRRPTAVQQVDAGNAGPPPRALWSGLTGQRAPGAIEGMAPAIDLCSVACHQETAIRAGRRRLESVNAGGARPAGDSANSVYW